MRGWTFHFDLDAAAEPGSPAHAGMDPLFCPIRDPVIGLPRACGDGPDDHVQIAVFRQAPPRMRGWTLGVELRKAGAPGSPAHAGMDLHAALFPVFIVGLPRACGDGPEEKARGRRTELAPPRMRGWTF